MESWKQSFFLKSIMPWTSGCPVEMRVENSNVHPCTLWFLLWRLNLGSPPTVRGEIYVFDDDIHTSGVCGDVNFPGHNGELLNVDPPMPFERNSRRDECKNSSVSQINIFVQMTCHKQVITTKETQYFISLPGNFSNSCRAVAYNLGGDLWTRERSQVSNLPLKWCSQQLPLATEDYTVFASNGDAEIISP